MFKRIHKYIKELKNQILLFFIKENLKKKPSNCTNQQKDLFERIKVGDMLWAYMPLTEKEIKKVPFGHEKRPYLVLQKDNDYFYAFSSTSIYKKNRKSFNYYGLNKDIYRNNKNSWILLNKIYKIPVGNIIDKLCSLNNEDLSRIQHRLLIREEKFNLKVQNYFANTNRLYKGDLIKCKNKYFYIYNSDSDYSYGYQVFKNNKHIGKKIYINDYKYYLKFTITNKFHSFKFDGTIENIAKGYEMLHIDKLIKENKTNSKVVTTKNKVKRKVENEKTPFEVGKIYENFNGSKFVFICNYKGKNYGADLFDIENDMLLKALSDIKSYRCIGWCCNNEFDTIMENILISENVSNKIQKRLIENNSFLEYQHSLCDKEEMSY